MVYLHFPNNHTEEEVMLQGKYQKLRKKKKALQTQKAPRPEPERTPTVLTKTLKRPLEGRDAREVAKKLIKSGAISPIVRTPVRTEQEGFKRPRGLERKLADKSIGYQPFQATQPEEPKKEFKPVSKDLYESFVTARNREERGIVEKKSDSSTPTAPEKPRSGNTIFVCGYKITEDFLRKTFHSYGNIVNISMEIEKNRGFITFDKPESSDRAISEMDGTMASGTQLSVSLARRQPVVNPINDATSSSTWSTLAASHSQKGSHHKEKRDLVVYDTIFDM